MSNPESHNLAKRLDATTWGLLLLVTGAFMVLPSNFAPEGAWLITAGVILLIMSIVRYTMKLGVSAFAIALGVVAILGGLSSAAGVRFPLFAAFLIVAGASIMVRSWMTHAEA